ncbi:HupE/UreJ family protein [Panacagrimonas sp.]|uniref:HupE/UreJ family protein n=1 Tax=Panacagrimonas sp. TaxID=2480088 RepID=UPI003B52912A
MKQILGLVVLIALLLPPSASAHRPSDAFLTLDVNGGMVSGQWEIALRDLAVMTDLDADGNRELTWGELRRAGPALQQTLLQHLKLQGDGRDCALRFESPLVHERSDGAYAWFTLSATCAETPRTLGVDYRLLFDVDPTHRGLLTLTAGSATHALVLGPDSAPSSIDLASPSPWRTFGDYLIEGVWHIWIGYDHVLFLLALLLPAVLRYDRHRWVAQERLAPALWNVFGVVTAFTLAHSVTLTLAALGLVNLPIRWVEAAIAASVLLAALNNIKPLVIGKRWLVAFAFGLIHGFGFASVLGELGLPQGLRVVALAAFNLGVELGQLAIVIVAVPIAFALRDTSFYRVGLRVAGSAAVAVLATLWLGQRVGLLSG